MKNKIPGQPFEKDEDLESAKNNEEDLEDEQTSLDVPVVLSSICSVTSPVIGNLLDILRKVERSGGNPKETKIGLPLSVVVAMVHNLTDSAWIMAACAEDHLTGSMQAKASSLDLQRSQLRAILERMLRDE